MAEETGTPTFTEITGVATTEEETGGDIQDSGTKATDSDETAAHGDATNNGGDSINL